MKYRKLRVTKYEVVETELFLTRILGQTCEIRNRNNDVLCNLSADGSLIVFPGYAWDGPSGPTIDTASVMRGSLVHDVFYQLIRESKLDVSYRKTADELLKRTIINSSDILIADMAAWRRPAARAWAAIRSRYYYRAVRAFARGAATTPDDDTIYEAP